MIETESKELRKDDGQKYHAMIVDDSQFMVLNLSRILTSYGIEIVTTAADGTTAINEYNANKSMVDFITLDITMPGKSGLEVLQAIKNEDPNVTIIMVTALGHEEVVKTAIQLGAKYYIVKPFQRETVYQALKFALK